MSGTVGETTDNGSATRTDPSGLRGLAERRAPSVLAPAPPTGRPSPALIVVVAVVAAILLAGGALAIGRALTPQEPVVVITPVPTCWDGTPQRAGSCPALVGQEALTWVFPATPEPSCEAVQPQGGGELETFKCGWPDLTASVFVSRWDKTTSVDTYFDGNFAMQPAQGRLAGTKVWQTPTLIQGAGPGYALSYENFPYSVLVMGSVSQRDAAVARIKPRTVQELEFEQ